MAEQVLGPGFLFLKIVACQWCLGDAGCPIPPCSYNVYFDVAIICPAPVRQMVTIMVMLTEKKHNLKVESYVLFGELSEDFKLRTQHLR